MKVLIDTNVILDFLLKREPYYNSSKETLMICTHNNDVKGYIAMHSVNDIWYILRDLKQLERRKCLKLICTALTVGFTNHNEVYNAISNEKFTDFEDCLVDSVAYVNKVDYIITRNVKDYKTSRIKALTPMEFNSL